MQQEQFDKPGMPYRNAGKMPELYFLWNHCRHGYLHACFFMQDVPIHADVHELPYADGKYFDTIGLIAEVK